MKRSDVIIVISKILDMWLSDKPAPIGVWPTFTHRTTTYMGRTTAYMRRTTAYMHRTTAFICYCCGR